MENGGNAWNGSLFEPEFVLDNEQKNAQFKQFHSTDAVIQCTISHLSETHSEFNWNETVFWDFVVCEQYKLYTVVNNSNKATIRWLSWDINNDVFIDGCMDA